jgi:signal transduction histidine kinase
VRRRLTLLVAATTCLVLLAFLVPLALLVRDVARDRALAGATTNLQGLIAVVGTADPESLRLSVEQVAATSRRPVTVFLADDTVLGTPAERSTAVELAARGRSLTVGTAAGHEIVVAVQGRPEGTAVVRTFVPDDELRSGVNQAWLVLAALGAALLGLGLLVADRLARTLTRPISELSRVSHRLANAELTARATPAGPPELREVAGALNHLAERIQDLLRDERERVADLSHRLRTPLTSLRLEAETLADPAEAQRIGAAVDGLQRAVTGLIQQARRRGSGGGTHCDAAAVTRERVEFWTVLAEDTGRTVRLDLAPGPLPVRVPADELAAALDAVLGNVFAHTPDGTAVMVTLVAAPGGGAVIIVGDEGPGLPAGHIERGASGGGSTGLGLDIARRAAQASGGHLALTSRPAGGTAVHLHLGA